MGALLDDRVKLDQKYKVAKLKKKNDLLVRMFYEKNGHNQAMFSFF